jgi:hypothetical protein
VSSITVDSNANSAGGIGLQALVRGQVSVEADAQLAKTAIEYFPGLDRMTTVEQFAFGERRLEEQEARATE